MGDWHSHGLMLEKRVAEKMKMTMNMMMWHILSCTAQRLLIPVRMHYKQQTHLFISAKALQYCRTSAETTLHA